MKLIIIFVLLFINVNAKELRELYFTGNCVTCHNIKEKKSAPSIMEIKQNYLNAFPKEKEFVDYMTKWVLKPNKKTSIMQFSIDEFGLMPELAYDEYTLRQIAKYIYNTDRF